MWVGNGMHGINGVKQLECRWISNGNKILGRGRERCIIRGGWR